MIAFSKVTKAKKKHGQNREILSLVDIVIPTDRRIALFAPSIEASTLVINLLSGVETPTSGHISRTANVSFPVGHAGGLQIELSLRQNIAHVARLYGTNPSSVIEFVGSIAGLRDVLDRRYRDLPTPLARLFAHVLAYSIPFDVYVLNIEPTRLPRDHREIELALFEARTQSSGAVIATHNPAFARQYCEMAMSLVGGKLVLFQDVEQAIAEGGLHTQSTRKRAGNIQAP